MTSFAETPFSPKDERKNGIGFILGDVTGLGVTYERRLTDLYSLQGAFAGFYNSPDETSEDLFLNFGLTNIFTLREQKDYKVFATAGGSFWLEKTKNSYTYYNETTTTSETETTSKEFEVGSTLGLTYFFTSSKAFGVSGQLGYGATFAKKNSNESYDYKNDKEFKFTELGPQGSFAVKFYW